MKLEKLGFFPIAFLMGTLIVFGQGQDSLRAVGGVLTINLVPSQSRYKVFVDQTITSTVITNPIPTATITVLFVQDGIGHTVAFGGNISGACSVALTASSTTGCQFTFDAANNQWSGVGGSTSTAANTFNVKSFGAKGDTQVATATCTLNSTSTVVCTGVTFAAGDVGKRMNCGQSLGGGLYFTAGTTISTFVSSSTVTLSNATGSNTSNATCAWGTQDDTAVGAAVTAWLAAIRASSGQGPRFQGATPANPPVLYFPTGGYLLCSTTNNSIINTSATFGGGVIQGDAPRESWLIGCDNQANSGGLGFFINQQSGGNQLVIKNLAFTNAVFPGGANAAVLLGGTHLTENLYFTDWNGGNAFLSTGSGYNLNLIVDNSGQGSNAGVQCTACQDEFHYGGSSNNGNHVNTAVSSVVGLNTGNGVRFVNWLNDECGSAASCFNITNSSDVWFIGSALFSTTGGQALNVDGTSFVHLNGGIVGVFGNDTNASGLKVQAGGVVQSTDVRYVGSGTGNPINNSGVFNDDGGNTNESQFPIASGTSTGTTAVLTLTNVGAAINTNCAVGDALMVQGVGIVGYNGYYPAGATSGITAVSATTVTYTTAGSNLGALGAGGTAYCRNMLTFAGNLPRALLNNPIPNTCYVTITPITNATTFNMCQWGVATATNITRITATSQVVTTCATPPIITISNGTVSETLTLTSGKQFWDSFNAQDASTGVGTTIFKPSISLTGTDRITMKYDVAAASACATPPTNLSVSYTIAPILSN